MQAITQFAADVPHISLAAEDVFTIAGFGVSNALLLGVFGYAILLGLLFYTVYVVKKDKKRNFLVRLLVWTYEGLYRSVLEIVGDRKLARSIAPLPISLFFFIIMQYWLGIIPIVGPIEVNGIPLFRGLAADLNTTFALAIVTIVTAQIYAAKVHGFFGNIGRYLKNPIKNPAGAFEGVLELIAEFSRLVALSLRLFGNVFAGEVLLIMIAFLTSYAAVAVLPPFYIFELFIGGIQAYIFFMLTTVFISLGLNTSHGDSRSHDEHHSPAPHTSTPVIARE